MPSEPGTTAKTLADWLLQAGRAHYVTERPSRVSWPRTQEEAEESMIAAYVNGTMTPQNKRYAVALERLRAEVERLRAGLAEIAKATDAGAYFTARRIAAETIEGNDHG